MNDLFVKELPETALNRRSRIARKTVDIPDDEAALLTAELNKIIESDD